MRSTIKYYRVDRREIHFLKFILEAYDGIAMFRTVDPDAGVVMLHIAPGCEAEANAVLADLRKEILIEDATPVTSDFYTGPGNTAK